MKKQSRVIFDFGTTFFSIFSEGKLLLRKPAAIILKKSVQTSAVHVGEEALALKGHTANDEFFRCPVENGAVVYHNECVILVRSYLKEVFGVTHPPVCVLVNCGLKTNQRREIEQVFIDAGYADIFLMEAVWGLKPALDRKNMNVGVIIGGENTEIGVFYGKNLVCAHTINIGSATINGLFDEFFRKRYNLILPDASLENLKKEAAPLFSADGTKFTVGGNDSITGKSKTITLSAHDLLVYSEFVYSKIVELIDATLSSLNVDLVTKIAETGILFAGNGSLQTGLRDYAAEKLGKIKVEIADRAEFLPLSGAELLCLDRDFIEEYLGLKK